MLLPLTFCKNCAGATQILKNKLKDLNMCHKMFEINEKSIIQMDELILWACLLSHWEFCHC